MNFINKIKQLQNKMDLSKKYNYKFNKIIFNSGILLMIVLFIIIWGQTGFQNINKPLLYLTCNSSQNICENKFYQVCNPNSLNYRGDYDICSKIDKKFYSKEYLEDGETIGEKPSILLQNAGLIYILIILTCFLFNHVLYNKERKINE